MKLNISISKDGEFFEDFQGIEFPELDEMTEEQRAKFIEDYCQKAAEKMATDNLKEK